MQKKWGNLKKKSFFVTLILGGSPTTDYIGLQENLSQISMVNLVEFRVLITTNIISK